MINLEMVLPWTSHSDEACYIVSRVDPNLGPRSSLMTNPIPHTKTPTHLSPILLASQTHHLRQTQISPTVLTLPPPSPYFFFRFPIISERINDNPRPCIPALAVTYTPTEDSLALTWMSCIIRPWPNMWGKTAGGFATPSVQCSGLQRGDPPVKTPHAISGPLTTPQPLKRSGKRMHVDGTMTSLRRAPLRGEGG